MNSKKKLFVNKCIIILLQVDKVYAFSNFIIQSSKSCIVNKFCIICTQNTKIIPCDFASDMPRLTYDNLTVVGEIESINKDQVIDIVAICEDFGDIQYIDLKNGYPGRKRDLWLIDHSNRKVLVVFSEILN